MKRSKEDAKKLAASIVNDVNRDKTKFELLVAKLSEDLSNKDKGGDLGYNPPGRMVPAFDDFTIDNKPGSVGVVETDFGFHVIGVTDHKNLQKAMKFAILSKEILAASNLAMICKIEVLVIPSP